MFFVRVFCAGIRLTYARRSKEEEEEEGKMKLNCLPRVQHWKKTARKEVNEEYSRWVYTFRSFCFFLFCSRKNKIRRHSSGRWPWKREKERRNVWSFYQGEGNVITAVTKEDEREFFFFFHSSFFSLFSSYLLCKKKKREKMIHSKRGRKNKRSSFLLFTSVGYVCCTLKMAALAKNNKNK